MIREGRDDGGPKSSAACSWSEALPPRIETGGTTLPELRLLPAMADNAPDTADNVAKT
ncbi:MAG TPA: hypothetical protein PLD59_08585 [Tepidisphaeraceae bacterium]|nr:hypothetical protein [Tepidisphaeraceae bacterium]